MSRTIVLGTRASPLAIAQTDLVVDLLKKKIGDRRFRFKVKTIKTAGDDLFRRPNSKLTGKDAFTGAIDSALIKGEIDVAVHSLKDVPVENFQKKKIAIAAFPRRGSPFDVLICRKKGSHISTLPFGARIGTSSVRRALQLKAFRPDLEVTEIHGNVHTRMRKLRNGIEDRTMVDAIVLAEAGLDRLGLHKEIDEVLPEKTMLPAVGQGCLAVVVKRDNTETMELISTIDHKATRQAVTAERFFSFELGGGCNLPIAALAKIGTKSTVLILNGLAVGKKRGNNLIIRDKILGPADEPESLGKDLARKIKSLM